MRLSRTLINTVWCTVLVVIVGVGWTYWQNREIPGRRKVIRYGIAQTSIAAIDRSAHNREKTIEVAKKLRVKWEPWARANRGVINSFQTLDTSDSNAVAEIYNKLPTLSDGSSGIRSSDLGSPLKSLAALADPNLIHFTWNVVSTKNGQEPNKWIRQQIQERKDYPLASSINVGRNGITLWASGKITEEITAERKNPKKGETYFAEPKSVVLVQPYD